MTIFSRPNRAAAWCYGGDQFRQAPWGDMRTEGV